ncbi:hypothetical protein [Pseudoalteromonas luteoviolacea]|uniref:Uncharacterized protein n=1 Tax=Pseudoalteromonas luteoviolacea NCIMB 1942 TaxID=1365253 RepID=A0A167G917_9GAMM|nr:hypothetical protein [Pseudoalteromonas luteoviolacea]KZN54330.1 hypothetical protein N482_05630 [Pseudoalteromonas luteoviolacea NCIMB 1942]
MISLRFFPKDMPQHQPAVAHIESKKRTPSTQPNNNTTSPHEHIASEEISDAPITYSGQIAVMEKPH